MAGRKVMVKEENAPPLGVASAPIESSLLLIGRKESEITPGKRFFCRKKGLEGLPELSWAGDVWRTGFQAG